MYPQVLHATDCSSWRLGFDITQKHQHATIEPGSTANALTALFTQVEQLIAGS